MKLMVGTPKWSSWSMRPWLALTHAGAAFEQQVMPLREFETSEALQAISVSGLCPVLIDGDLTIWDSLAICEYLADRLGGLWPADIAARALGRAACALMHSGFQSLRGECPMDLAAPPQTMELTEATVTDVRRMVRLWLQLRARFGGEGPFLLGAWSIADAYFTPVATRFRTYGVNLAEYGDDAGEALAYGALLLRQPEFLAWERLALAA